MNNDLIEAYKSLFNNYREISPDEYLAKESLQNTMLRILSDKKLCDKIEKPKPMIRAMARFASSDMFRGHRDGKKLWYSSETSQSYFEEDGTTKSVYEKSIDEVDYGQICSVDDRMELVSIFKFLGEELSFFLDHTVFPNEGRPKSGKYRGVTGVAHAPRIFNTPQEKNRFNYLRSKIRKKYG